MMRSFLGERLAGCSQLWGWQRRGSVGGGRRMEVDSAFGQLEEGRLQGWLVHREFVQSPVVLCRQASTEDAVQAVHSQGSIAVPAHRASLFGEQSGQAIRLRGADTHVAACAAAKE